MADAAASAVSSAIDKTKTKATRFFDKAKGKLDAAIHSVGDKMDLDDVKAPKVFERVKEEVEALVETASAKSDEITGAVKEKFHSIAGDAHSDDKASEVKIEEGSSLLHNKETHGTSSDINEDTPVDAVKAPGIFQRAKEEVDALVQTIHPKKEPTPETEEGGFGAFFAKLLQKICHPWDSKKDEPKSD